jgi:hypothetical protein
LKALEDGWVQQAVTPRFSGDWYEAREEMPQVTVTHLVTRPEALGLSQDVGNSKRRFIATYAVDVWAKDPEQRHMMTREVDRIVHFRCQRPGGELEFMETLDWVDLDEATTRPRIYRSRLRVEVLYYG